MFRIGFGNDIHRLVHGRKLVIGGVRIESELGAEGHSDADVLVHAVTDAVLGALALGDIGTHFPNTDERWRNADSLVFLGEAIKLIKIRGYSVVNMDSTVSLENPRLKQYITEMARNFSDILEVDEEFISIKAKTGEGIDAVGKGEAVRADAVILLSGSALAK